MGHDVDGAEADGIVVTSESEVAGGANLARMWRVSHVVGDLGNVAVKNHSAVQLDADG